MTAIEWILLFIIGIPVAVFCVDSFLQRIKQHEIVSSHEEQTHGIVIRKYYLPDHENRDEPDVLTDDMSFVYLAYATIPSQYIVEVELDKDILVLDSENMYHVVRIGHHVDLTLEHIRMLQTCLYSKHHSFKMKLKDFQIRPEVEQFETREEA